MLTETLLMDLSGLFQHAGRKSYLNRNKVPLVSILIYHIKKPEMNFIRHNMIHLV